MKRVLPILLLVLVLINTYMLFLIITRSNIKIIMTKGTPDTWYVDNSAKGTEDGTDWNNAFYLLSDAVKRACADDIILVREGHYENMIDMKK